MSYVFKLVNGRIFNFETWLIGGNVIVLYKKVNILSRMGRSKVFP